MLGRTEFVHCLGIAATKLELVLLASQSIGFTDSTFKEVAVFLVGEVDVIVSVGVREHRGVVPIVFPSGVSLQVRSVVPSLELQVTDRAAPVEVRDHHSALVSFVINDLRT